MRRVRHPQRFPSALSVLCALSLSNCATAPDDLVWDNVSPEAYASFDCDQLAEEIVYLGFRVRHLYGRLADRRTRDEWQAGFSWYLGITALFLDGDGPEAEEYQHLRGQFEAARVQALNKQCGFEAATPEAIIDNAVAHLEAADNPPD